MYRILPIFIFYLLVCVVNSSAAKIDKKVVLINSYHTQYQWTDDLTKTIARELEEVIPRENLMVEYLDSRKFGNDPKYQDIVINLLRYKFQQNHDPDIIITTDDYAFQLVLKYSEQLRNVPVIFGGVNIFSPSMLNGKQNIKGVLEGYEIRKNLELIRSNHTKLNKIYLLADQSPLGQVLISEARKIATGMNLKLEVLDNHSIEEMNFMLATAKKEDVAFVLAVHHDKNGKYFSYSYDLKEMSHVSNVPIYGMWGILINQGVIGGYTTDAKTHAKEIASMAIRVLKGERIENINIVEQTKYIPQFDYNELKRFDVNESILPVDSVIFNKPVTFYDQYKKYIWITIALIFALIIINIILQILVTKRTDELHKLNERMREFVGIVAHDLRNPIGAIIGFVDVLKEDKSEIDEVLPYIQRGANQSLTMINDILDLSAIESGKIEMNFEKIRLKELVNEVFRQFHQKVKAKNIQLLEVIDDDVLILGDPKRLSQVLQNLVGNAIKFTSNGGKVEVKVKEVGLKVKISVEDDGIGIPANIIHKLFDKNEKTSRTGTGGESGTGYGLPLVYDLIKRHNSLLKCESEIGSGARFFFELDKAF